MRVWKTAKRSATKWVLGVFAATLLLTSASAGMLAVPALADEGKGSANERIIENLNLAAGKQKVDGEFELTEEETRFLGVFLSNFYVPFVTELGGGANDESTKATKDAMVKVLSETLLFEKPKAEALVNSIIGSSKANMKTLTWGYANVEFPGLGGVEKDDKATASYYSLMQNISGKGFLATGDLAKTFKECRGKTGDAGCAKTLWAADKQGGRVSFNEGKSFADVSPVQKKVMNGELRYGFLGYDQGGQFVPMFSVDMWGEVATPSVTALSKAQSTVDPKLGFGTALYDLTSDELNVKDTGSTADVKKFLDAESRYKSTILGSSLKISPYGDIVVAGANHQVVALPGAMNPYTWKAVTDKGEDMPASGTAVPLINFPWMASIAKGEAFTSQKASAKTGRENFQLSADANFSKYEGEILPKGSNFLPSSELAQDGGFKIPVTRGDSQSEIKREFWEVWGTATAKDEDLIKDPYNLFYGLGNNFIKNPYGDNNKGTFASMGFYGTWDQHPIGVRRAEVFNKARIIDDMNMFGWGQEGDLNFAAAEKDLGIPLIDAEGKVSGVLAGADELASEFGNTFQNEKANAVKGKGAYNEVTSNMIVSVYYTYALSALYEGGDKAYSLAPQGYRMNITELPTLSNQAIDWTDANPETLKNERNEAILDWMYYLLHPSEIGYFFEWANNKLTGLILGWQDDVLGTEGVGILTGSTKFLSFSGYVTTPNLYDVKWTSDIVDLYKGNIVYVMIIVFALMICYAVARVLTVQRALAGAAIFILGSLLPVGMINFAVDTSNQVSDSIYSKKFTYWALTQHQSYSKAIDSSAQSKTYEDYIGKQYAAKAKARDSAGGSSIVLRWQAPKKASSLQLSEEDKKGMTDSVMKMGGGLFANTYSGESFLDGDRNTYMYRSYVDISNFSRFFYAGTKGAGVSGGVQAGAMTNWPEGLKKAYSTRNATFEDDRAAGYANPTINGSKQLKDAQRVTIPLSSKIVGDALARQGKVKDMKITDYAGIQQDMFGFGVPAFTGDKNTFITSLKTENLPDPSMGGKYTNTDYYGLASYGLMSENVFYNFSWMLYDNGMSTGLDAKEGYKNMLLGGANSKFFYNVDEENVVNGEMKDYMDMKSLFTYTIPYLTAGNDVVREWDSIYGLKLNPGVPSDPGHENESEIKNDPAVAQKYWHNVNVANLYNMYSPWVDLMNDSSYTDSTKVQVAGKNVVVSNPMDPSTYPAERPMVFSQSEMMDYGLKANQLTEVEKKIQNVQKNTQASMIKLLNYYSFDDSVLNTAAAMSMTFEFNKEFSESNFFGTSNVIYPQSYELKNFTYDAFLRLILSNTTGLDLTEQASSAPEDSFYSQVAQQSSIFAAIAMLVNSLLSSYLVPAFKWAFVVGILLTSVAMLISSAVQIEQRLLKNIVKSLVKPLLIFLLVNVGMAFFVSLFMSNGYSEITGDEGFSISMGDPVVVMLVMIALNLGLVFLYFKLLASLWKDLKGYGKAVFSSVSGAVSGAAGALVDGATGGRVSTTRSRLGGAMMAGAGAVVGGAMARRNYASQREKMDNRALKNQSKMMAGAGGRGGSGGMGTGGGGGNEPSVNRPTRRARRNSAVAGTVNAVRNPIKSAKSGVQNAKAAMGARRARRAPDSIKEKIRQGRERMNQPQPPEPRP